MNESQMKEQIQSANDMIETLVQQRDSASNQVVQLAAQNKALQRKVAEMEKAAAVEVPTEAEVITPKANGHAEAAATH